ncbi:Mammalian cell entry related domain protein [Halothece sp. PCC 7418]|uniref:MlaD family protein n=1 Tax=Halothece sp. (strain PCC 7418) TaxID=65093 RepID=UPI0002A0662C|nr:MlaD family protein [Halothece sp. PCC 7418]AFZ43564.1 Mammalian cell entry related domain protein [Halothece sp. PCC 7418]
MRSRTIREGSVGLLILFGFILFGGLFIWLRGFKLGQQSYNITIAFRDANRVIAGSPVRYRGVNVGEVVSINPNANGVNIEVKINRVDLSIPRENLLVEANQSGLIGETSIDIYPQVQLASDQAGINPLSEDCNSQIVVCENDTIDGKVGASIDVLIRNTAEAAELISDPELFNNLKNVAQSATDAADGIAEVSRELSEISGDVSQQLKVLTTTTSQQLRVLSKTTEKTGEQVIATAAEAEELIGNVNRVVVANQKNVETTLAEISATSQQLNQLVDTLAATLQSLNSNLEATDTQELIRNLETLTANAAATSENLKKASATLSSSENLVLLQQTLDSARATFENTQKITSDLDELTGNPEFRQDLEDLIKGLSDLLSSTQDLEQQLAIAEKNNLELKQD